MTHEPLVLGQLNDGIETQYPSTDVVRLSGYVQCILGVELDRRLSDQLPGWTTVQGEVDTPRADKGIAIAPGLMTVQSSLWTLMLGKNEALTVRADFLGSPLSLITAHRPTTTQSRNWPTFDAALGKLVRSERRAGRVPIVGIDCNEPDPTALEEATGSIWSNPFASCVCGVLLPRNVDQIGITWLSTSGEHPPVIDLVKVPVKATT